jgi:hypothetical protein
LLQASETGLAGGQINVESLLHTMHVVDYSNEPATFLPQILDQHESVFICQRWIPWESDKLQVLASLCEHSPGIIKLSLRNGKLSKKESMCD